ncbi:hypothetical protein ACSBOB_10520 [Mesorhizobium sp. ASY16-5R]|uniref:hypothetical protein n=1 Tax=Mesorhizobium sp. ASY16-5R TaxID=3445772 RepID=UPI003FA05C83
MGGTRFRLFVQPPFEDDLSRPEIITVSSPAGSLRVGPSDDSMYVIVPDGKARAYGLNIGPLGTPFLYLPPWQGRILAPAVPDRWGNFDHYRPDVPGFEAAHAFGCARFTLDVWERYLDRPLAWHFSDHYNRLEIDILPGWNNAQYGYGFLELGSQLDGDGGTLPFSLDFDIIAHEVGHAIIYGILGIPDAENEYPEYLGFQESFADCVSLIAAMHFPSVVENVLEETRGNLYLANRLARFSELSPHRQIRSANNKRTMADFVDGWKNEHDLSEPLTGAIFDSLVDIFHESLVSRGLISPEVAAFADAAQSDPSMEGLLQDEFDAAFARDAEGFADALLDARDVVGTYLAATLQILSPDQLDYGNVADAMLAADRMHSGGEFSDLLDSNFRRRHIGELHAGRRLASDAGARERRFTRTLLPTDSRSFPKMSYRENFLLRNNIRI